MSGPYPLPTLYSMALETLLNGLGGATSPKDQETVCEEALSKADLKRAAADHVPEERNGGEAESAKDWTEQGDREIPRATEPDQRCEIGVDQELETELGRGPHTTVDRAKAWRSPASLDVGDVLELYFVE